MIWWVVFYELAWQSHQPAASTSAQQHLRFLPLNSVCDVDICSCCCCCCCGLRNIYCNKNNKSSFVITFFPHFDRLALPLHLMFLVMRRWYCWGLLLLLYMCVVNGVDTRIFLYKLMIIICRVNFDCCPPSSDFYLWMGENKYVPKHLGKWNIKR